LKNRFAAACAALGRFLEKEPASVNALTSKINQQNQSIKNMVRYYL
jgi:hypothetical protein